MNFAPRGARQKKRYHRLMKHQLIHRLGIPHIQHVLSSFNSGDMKATQAMEELGISRSRLFSLRKEFLDTSRKDGKGAWIPNCSGGNHYTPWPADATTFLNAALSQSPPYSYAFAASEIARRLAFNLDRSQVRWWALNNGLDHAKPRERPSCHQRRWQRSSIGELWQLDATPFAWFGGQSPTLPMLNMIDDCSRKQVGGSVYGRETLNAYIHFLRTALEKYGLPLQIYVDQASFFKSTKEGNATKLQNRLKFYDISFIFANSAESKGKIERLHQVWQDRLPPFFTSNGIPETLNMVNQQIDELIDWRNKHDIHRETKMRAEDAWTNALTAGRNKLRPTPQCPWWTYIWASQKRIQVGIRGRVNIDLNEVSIQAKSGSWVVLCDHLDGTHTILAEFPQKEKFPKVLFSDRPRQD